MTNTLLLQNLKLWQQAAQIDLIKKATEFDAKLRSISDRITLNRSKYLLVEYELKKLEKLDAAYIRGKHYFDGDDGTQSI